VIGNPEIIQLHEQLNLATVPGRHGAGSTRFLMIYCPSKVGTKGNITKVSAGKRINGVIVPSIWVNKRNRVRRKNNPVINPRPISVSQIARMMIDISG
jgi:hypothetical protein